jgi:hypothetical protein
MRRFLQAFILVTAAAFMYRHAAAQSGGPNLYEACVTAHRGSIEDRACNLYLSGISTGFYLAQQVYGAGGHFCFPNEEALDVRQVRAITEKYLRDHPEKMHEKAPLLVLLALAQAFPCKSSN